MGAERDFLVSNSMRKAQQDERPEYLGALLEGERRLVLVAMDPQEPWEAFRRMRSWMRQMKSTAEADVDVFSPDEPFETDRPVETDAKIIPFRQRSER